MVAQRGLGMGGWVGELLDVVKDGLSGGYQLHQQVEVADITTEDRAAVPERAEKDEGVVHGSAAVLVPGVLEAGEDAGEDGGFAPDITVGIEDAILRPTIHDAGDLPNHITGARMSWVEAAAQICHLRFRHRAVPRVEPGDFTFQMI